MIEEVPQTRLVTVPQAGHIITLENPNAVNGTLKDSLSGLLP